VRSCLNDNKLFDKHVETREHPPNELNKSQRPDSTYACAACMAP
jgi:hypothetical protein